jgi:hypothetical protein
LSPLSACLGDVYVPPCVHDGNCNNGLSAGGAGGSSAAAPGPIEAGGEGGGTGVGAAGEGGASFKPLGTGETDDGGAPPCEDCLISPVALAPGCAGHIYAATLRIEGGSAPYSWQLTQAPEGWSVAAAATAEYQAVLHGDAVPQEGVTLTVKATDAHGQSTTQTLHLEVRSN